VLVKVLVLAVSVFDEYYYYANTSLISAFSVLVQLGVVKID